MRTDTQASVVTPALHNSNERRPRRPSACRIGPMQACMAWYLTRRRAWNHALNHLALQPATRPHTDMWTIYALACTSEATGVHVFTVPYHM